jgi:hypothetical protein
MVAAGEACPLLLGERECQQRQPGESRLGRRRLAQCSKPGGHGVCPDQRGVERLEHPELMHQGEGALWRGLVKGQQKLSCDPLRGCSLQQMMLKRIGDQGSCTRLNRAAKPGSQACRAEDPGWVVDKAQVMQYPDQPSFQVAPAAIEIIELSIALRVQADCQRVDCKIAPVQVVAE